jgi:hypothetical protein
MSRSSRGLHTCGAATPSNLECIRRMVVVTRPPCSGTPNLKTTEEARHLQYLHNFFYRLDSLVSSASCPPNEVERHTIPHASRQLSHCIFTACLQLPSPPSPTSALYHTLQISYHSTSQHPPHAPIPQSTPFPFHRVPHNPTISPSASCLNLQRCAPPASTATRTSASSPSPSPRSPTPTSPMRRRTVGRAAEIHGVLLLLNGVGSVEVIYMSMRLVSTCVSTLAFFSILLVRVERVGSKGWYIAVGEQIAVLFF